MQIIIDATKPRPANYVFKENSFDIRLFFFLFECVIVKFFFHRILINYNGFSYCYLMIVVIKLANETSVPTTLIHIVVLLLMPEFLEIVLLGVT